MNPVRAWRDPEYRASLSPRERAALPASPVGVVDLSDDDLLAIEGGSGTTTSIPITATHFAGCYSFGESFCNGTCAFGGTQGCCP